MKRGAVKKYVQMPYDVYISFLFFMYNQVNLETCTGDRRLDLTGSSVHNGIKVIRILENVQT